MGVAELNKILDERNRLLELLLQEIEDLPDNPRIHRINENCFTINLGQVGNNLSPRHHDFKKAYIMVAESVRRSHDPVRTLQEIVEKRQVKIGNDRLNLHDDVIGHLENVLNS